MSCLLAWMPQTGKYLETDKDPLRFCLIMEFSDVKKNIYNNQPKTHFPNF